MRKCNLCKKVILVSGLTLTMLMTACSGSEKPGDMLIGSWVSEYNDIVTFEKDGRCTAPFTYNAYRSKPSAVSDMVCSKWTG